MRAQDIIRAVLDLLDQQEENKDNPAPEEMAAAEEEPSRFKQIVAMLDNPSQGEYANTPNEIVSSVNSVTKDVGGGPNGIKHPHDIRVKDPSMYPNQQGF